MILLSILSELFNFLSGLFLDSNPNTHQAIAPMLALGLGSAALQTGLGLFQSNKAGKMKVDTSREDAAMGKMIGNQQELINRAKVESAMSGEMPGQSEAEAKIGAATSRAATKFKEVGNQAGYQDFLNQALLKEQEALTNVYMEQVDYADRKRGAVDDAIAGMQNIYGEQLQSGRESSGRQRDAIAGAKQSAAQNISGGLTSAASAGLMALGDAGGGASNRTTKGQRQGRRAERRHNRQYS